MKVMKYFAVASLALFAACNNEENLVVPEGANQPVDVMMSVALPGPGTRAAMGDLQNTANNGDPATVEKLHVYLLKGDDIVFAKEFTKGSDDFTKLTSSTAVGAGEATGGYKFLNVDKGATKALVIANPQGALVENKPVSDVSKQLLKAKINEVIYAGSKELTTVGAESYGVARHGWVRLKTTEKPVLMHGRLSKLLPMASITKCGMVSLTLARKPL